MKSEYSTRFIERSGDIIEQIKVLSLALNNVTESQFRTDDGRELRTDGAAVLKERLPLKGTCSSGADDDRGGQNVK